jgi:hypothetical protein
VSQREVWVKDGPEGIDYSMTFTIDWDANDKVVVRRHWATMLLQEAGYVLQTDDEEEEEEGEE